MLTRNRQPECSKELIEEILSRLATYAVRDTDFPSTESLSEDSYVAIVYNGLNYKIKIEDFAESIGIVPVTEQNAGLMSADDKKKLNSLNIYYNTTAYWNSQIGFIPKAGSIIIYSDFKTEVIDGKTVNIPGIKIGSGNGYVQDLAFANDTDTTVIMEHIANNVRHITQEKRLLWNNKLNVTDYQEVVEETLIFNRD